METYRLSVLILVNNIFIYIYIKLYMYILCIRFSLHPRSLEGYFSDKISSPANPFPTLVSLDLFEVPAPDAPHSTYFSGPTELGTERGPKIFDPAKVSLVKSEDLNR